MRHALLATLVVALGVPAGRTPLLAQGADTVTRAHLASVLTADARTPGGKGLLATALAEARTALTKAGEASLSRGDLGAMQTHARAVIHAVDPGLVATGPGLGYGLKPAVAELVQQVTSLAAADRKADVTRTAPRALAAAGHVLQWSDALVAAAQRILVATTAAEAAPLTRDLVRLARQVTTGVDANADGRITFAAGEGGLHAVELSLGALLVSRAGVTPSLSTGVRP